MRILFAVFLISFYLVSCSDEKKYTQEIAPPFKNVEVAYHQMEVDASEDKVLRLNNGSSISIPKNAFVDKNGKPVTGKVKLEYREFHSAADIIASGIPMVYEDEKGEKKIMESGGMFELKGKVNNEEVFISKGKELGVSMASGVSGEFDFYHLEEEAKVQQSEASLAFIGNAYGQNEGSEKRKARWLKLTNNVDKPEAEESISSDAPHFSLKFDTVKFPETKALRSVKWFVAKEAAGMNPLDKSNAWVTGEKWQIADISSPKNVSKLNNEIGDLPNQGLLFLQNYLDDSSGVVVQKDGINLYTFSGKKMANFPDTTISYFSAMSGESKRIVTHHKEGKNMLWTFEGKKLKDLGEGVNDVHFLNKGTRLIYTTRDAQFQQMAHLTDANGKEIATIKLTAIKESGIFYNYVRDLHVSKNKKYFLIRSGEGIRIWDSNGKLLNTYVVPEGKFVDNLDFVSHDNSIFISFRDGGVKIWDWKNNKWYSPGDNYTSKINSAYQGGYYGGYIHPTSPIMIINGNDEGGYLWNWKNNSIKKLSSKMGAAGWYGFDGCYIHFNSGNNKDMDAIFNEDGELVVERKVHIGSSPDKQSALFHSGAVLEWRDRKGKLIKNFSAYDSSIQYGVFVNNEQFMTSNGSVFNVWDKNGNILKTIPTAFGNRYILKASDKYIYTITWNKSIKVWDYQGNLVQDVGQIDWLVPVMPDDTHLVVYSGSSIKFWEITSDTLPSNVYLLSLRGDKKAFSTYVMLNNEDLKKIEDYKRGKDVKLEVEEKRAQKETALIRSFQIRNFGVYNWDRFYKDENMVAVNADFDLGSATNGYNEVTVFLIMGAEQNTVVKYYKGTWDKFKFDPKVPNQLLAVLPDDQIAIFDRKEFEKLNAEEIRKSGKYTFKMKVLNKVESVGALDKILKSPS